MRRALLDPLRYWPFRRGRWSQRSPFTALISTEDLAAGVAAATGACREDIWVQIIQQMQAKYFLELGVFRGAFAEHILRRCPSITHYYMLDPWGHLDDWNKPANVSQPTFDEIYSEAMGKTDFARQRRIVLRGRTTEMIDRIPDESLDIAYIDGDHTLRGIAIDLIRTYPKVRPGGILGGDDYTPTIWQHADNFEPSLVCPFAAYFAESQEAPIVILRHSQFAIVKPPESGRYFRVIDTTNSYGPRSLLPQISRRI
jgi:predicted O-methyltransferase YrrM